MEKEIENKCDKCGFETDDLAMNDGKLLCYTCYMKEVVGRLVIPSNPNREG